jgi:hypothetical protein
VAKLSVIWYNVSCVSAYKGKHALAWAASACSGDPTNGGVAVSFKSCKGFYHMFGKGSQEICENPVKLGVLT